MNYLIRRLREPSTHAGIAAVAIAAGTLFPQYSLILNTIAAMLGAGAAATPERKP